VRDVGEGSSDEEGRGRKNEDTDARRRKRKGEVRTFWSIRKKKYLIWDNFIGSGKFLIN
jgi:hypothetical protein